MNYKIVALVIYLLMFMGCMSSVKVDPERFIVDKGEKENIPTVCKFLYDSSMSAVAIAPFSNNTSFDYAAEIQTHVSGVSQKQVKGKAAVSAEQGTAKASWGIKERRAFERDTRMSQRTMYSKLSESVEDSVIEQMKSISGLKVYARTLLSQRFRKEMK